MSPNELQDKIINMIDTVNNETEITWVNNVELKKNTKKRMMITNQSVWETFKMEKLSSHVNVYIKTSNETLCKYFKLISNKYTFEKRQSYLKS